MAIVVPPLLEDHSPFPTTFWLTCPRLVDAVHDLESAGEGARYAALAAADPSMRVGLAAADTAYREARLREADGADPCADVGLAGQKDPFAVKCLHARCAAYLCGVPDPIGEQVAALLVSQATASCDDARCLRVSGSPVSIAAMDTSSMTSPDAGPGLRRVAAIDIGTVTTRLLVADTDGTVVHEVLRRTVVTHLGEGLLATGELSVSGIGRVAAAVTGFVADIDGLRAGRVVAVATSAARDARNGAAFLDAVASAGVRPRIIPGRVEARLSFAGAAYGIGGEAILVADLGGGSTELILGSAGMGDGGRGTHIDAARSLDIGSRRVLDMFLHSDPPTPQELDTAASWVAAQMESFFAGLPHRPRELITLAGTGTTLSAVKQGLTHYDPAKVHGSRLSGADVADLLAELAAMDVATRRGVVGMDPARADVIVAGALILHSIIALAGLDGTTISEHDILYGLVLAGPEGLEER
jgi:exopolyphosphatase/guanosine-5'-triphosphate,3'-diphosphate pyrophosphatase